MKPLLRVINIEGPNNRMIQLTLAYECLPNFCYHCGLLGYLVKDCFSCMELIGENGKLDESSLAYGALPRACSFGQGMNHIGGSVSRSTRQFVSRIPASGLQPFILTGNR